jgi:hypothetical protein
MQPPRTKHWPWIALVAAVLVAGGLVLTYGRNRSGNATVATGSGVRNGTIGTPVTRDGIFEYTVTSFACGAAAVGGVVPKGRFCTAGITLHNISGTPHKPGISFATVFDAQGAEYLADAVAQLRTDRDGSSLLDDLAPGARLASRLFYDVPKTATITSALLRESPSSPGIRIALSRAGSQ